jgi:iron(III) transport system substrate-binding protein
VVLIADGPNPQGGKRVIDYLLRPETEAALARGEAAQMPLRADVELPEGFRFQSVSKLNTMAVDYGKLAQKLDELSHGFLKDWVDQNL